MYWLFDWFIRWRAENAMMHQYGVSRAYVREVVKNLDDWNWGTIDYTDWLHRACEIAERYPRDADRALEAR